jgi:hypothetical protein
MGTLIEGPRAIAQGSVLVFAAVAYTWANPNIGGY